jgi:hypothetical protein
MEKNETTSEIETKIELTAKDRERAMDYNFFVKRKWIFADIIFFALLSCFILIFGVSGIFDIPQVLIYMAFGLLGLLLLFFIFVKMMAQTGGGHSRYVKITNEALITRVSGEKKEFTVKWGDFDYIGKTKNYYFLYPDTTQFLILPKRCFSAEDIEAINNIIQ